MPPKKARRNPSKKKSSTPPPSREADAELSSSPSSKPISSSHSALPLPVAEVSRAHTPSPHAQPAPHIPVYSSSNKSKAKKNVDDSSTAAAPPRWELRGLLLLLAVVAIGVAFSSVGGAAPGPHQHHPCACATSAAAANPLAKALLSRRSGISGVHWQHRSGDPDRLDFASTCGDLAIVDLPDPFTSVEMLRRELQASFAKARRPCVVWVTTPEAVRLIANALKELLENNALGGEWVVPVQARGVLVVKSSHTREELKDLLPHRVVHMLTNIS